MPVDSLSGITLYPNPYIIPGASVPATVIDPKVLAEYCAEHNLPTEPWIGKCNSVTLPLGPESGIAYFLVPYSVLKPLADFITPNGGYDGNGFFKFSFTITDYRGTARDCFYWNLTEWRCVTPGIPNDPGAVYMITLRDERALVESECDISAGRMFNIPRMTKHSTDISANYNYFIRSTLNLGGTPEIWPGADSYDSPTDTSTAYWTWQQMIDSASAGLTPYALNGKTLPYTPGSTPVDFDFQGTPSYWATNAILDRLGCALKYNPFLMPSVASNAPFSYVEVGSSTTARDTALDAIADWMIWDYRPQVFFDRSATPILRQKVVLQDPYLTMTSSSTTFGLVPLQLMTAKNLTNPAEHIEVKLGLWGATLFEMYDGYRMAYDGGFGFTPATYSYMGRAMIDHDQPQWWTRFSAPQTRINVLGGTAETDARAEHSTKYVQSCLCIKGKVLNRVYAGLHTADDLLPGSGMKIVRWEDTGDGWKTHFYAGDNYLPPHAVYHLVNPHRYHRRDDMTRIPSVKNLDLTKII